MNEESDTPEKHGEEVEAKAHHAAHSKGHNAHQEHASPKEEKTSGFERYATVLIVLVALVMLFNQMQISAISSGDGVSSSKATGILKTVKGGYSGESKDLSSVDVDSLKSTAHTVAAVLDVENIKTEQDAIDVIIPTGTPEYGDELGVSFDDPIASLDVLSQKVYPMMKQKVKQDDPKTWARYIALASKPAGISCEYCCGVGPIGIRPNGDLNCGCSHAPALHGVALWLMENTDYTDAQVLREVMKWKALFFPKEMVNLGLQVAGGDTSSLENLPGMVGGC